MKRVALRLAPLALASVACGSSSGGEAAVDAGADTHAIPDAGRDARRSVDAAHDQHATRHDAEADAGATRTLSFGTGLTATLTAAGQLTITSAGASVLSTSPGQPLFTSAVDVDQPAAYHDPKNLAADTLTPLPSSAVTLDSPSPGVLHLVATDTRSDVVLVSVALGADSGFYTGLGERYDHVDPRGQIVGMMLELDGSYESGTTDWHVPVPWLVSSRGYGVFVADCQAGAWDVASTDATVVRSTFEGSSLDVIIVVDADPLAVIASLTRLTGLQRATPAWALAPMMWRHVDTQAQLLGDLAHIRSLHIPTTTFWIDDGWQVALDTLDFDPAKYPDVADVTSSTRSLGFKLFGWNSPYLQSPTSATDGGTENEAQALYPMAAAKGYFVEKDGAAFPVPGPGGASLYGLLDYTRASAATFWVHRAADPVRLGMDGFKLDYGEDMVPEIFGQRLGLSRSDGESERTARTYPLAYHGAYRQALATGGDGGVGDGGVLVVRASTYGGAQVADIVWPGDLDNGFQHYGDQGSGARLVGGLPASVVAAQTLAASGFALYGADTGGYRGGAPTKESLLRWAEHTALSMVMQLGPGEDKYPWNYDADTVTAYTALANLHQTLVPYLAGLLSAAQATGAPTLRALPLAFPTDPDAPSFADDEYMLGQALLVAPVVTQGATSRQVHLPPGDWFSYWDRPGGAAAGGATTLTVQAPIGKPPLFVLAGSLLPTLPPGIDTLVASDDPSTVSLGAMAGEDSAIGWVKGAASAICLDGSALAVTDDASGVGVTWSPSGTGHAVVVTLNLAARTGTSDALSRVNTIAGAALTSVSSAAAVSTATGGAYYLAGNAAVLRLVGRASIRIAP